MATQAEVDALTAQINEQRARYQGGQDMLTARESYELIVEIERGQRERERMIAEGCGPCLKCGAEPVGSIQQVAVGKRACAGFGIDCSSPDCGACARHVTLDAAREIWATDPEVRGQGSGIGINKAGSIA